MNLLISIQKAAFRVLQLKPMIGSTVSADFFGFVVNGMISKEFQVIIWGNISKRKD